MRKNLLDLYMQKIKAFPLWVRQAIYLALEKDLTENCCIDFIEDEDKNLAAYSPVLTFKGKTELAERKSGLDTNMYNFLACCAENYTIVEISLNTFLTMEEVCKIFELCIEQNFVKKPEALGIIAVAGYMSGKFRVGEYFKRVGILSIDDLQKSILEYDRLKSVGDDIKFARVLRKFELITDEEKKGILALKDEAKRRFILDYNDAPKGEITYSDDKTEYENKIATLKEENLKLKRKMLQLLELIKKNTTNRG